MSTLQCFLRQSIVSPRTNFLLDSKAQETLSLLSHTCKLLFKRLLHTLIFP